MRTTVSTKTLTEVTQKSGEFVITCFSDMNEDGTTTPSVYKSQVLEETKIIDNVSGKEGELILSHSGSEVGEINSQGELELEVENDDANKYSKNEQGDLIYDEW